MPTFKGTIEEKLKQNEIFRSLPVTAFKNLATLLRIEEIPAGTVLFQQGEVGSSMYLVLDGKVKMHSGENIIGENNEGNFFGEMALLNEAPRSLSATSVTDVRVAILGRDTFYNELSKYPGVLRNINNVIVSRSRDLIQRTIDEFRSREEELTKLVEIRTKDLQEKNESLAVALSLLKSAQDQLVQQEKLASLGQLTAGVAHEINNPLNFVSSGVPSLKRNFDDILHVLSEYDRLELTPDQQAKIAALKKDLDFAVTLEETETLFRGITDGASRTSEIVKGLRNFSRTDENEMKLADINEGIEATILLLSQKIEDKNIAVEKDLTALQTIACYPGQLNQLWMNLFSNAVDAVDKNGKISVSSKLSEKTKEVIISVKDNGYGIPESIRKKIFDPFFTTKDVGKGTGLGLSICYGIVERHKGKIEVKSEEKKGTEFLVTLPAVFEVGA